MVDLNIGFKLGMPKIIGISMVIEFGRIVIVMPMLASHPPATGGCQRGGPWYRRC